MSARAAKCWLAVACAEHVSAGRAAGIMQVCHGKAAPLRRIRAGDDVVYYSPAGQFRGADRLQAFTAIGRVVSADPYPFDMGGGFVAHRHDVMWRSARAAPIRPLLGELSFTAGRAHWGHALRFGLLEITRSDLELIAAAMKAEAPA
ncbi:EVE domain-containing protein [Aestuariivirga sp.]|uniref:EVE domain-containing protein n=1 Tax=Aestuariivirga sp. TaxID=2650926 RepID=UPI0035B16A3F